jgi:hypothetical protein
MVTEIKSRQTSYTAEHLRRQHRRDRTATAMITGLCDAYLIKLVVVQLLNSVKLPLDYRNALSTCNSECISFQVMQNFTARLERWHFEWILSETDLQKLYYHIWITEREIKIDLLYNIVTYTGYVCGSVTNNTTRVRIGYRIYSLWRFITTQVTIIETTIALA